MSNVDLNFVKSQMNLAVERMDMVAFRKWYNIWHNEHERIRQESMERCRARIAQIQREFVRDMARINSWSR